jgi:hypothetical protein
MKMAEGGINIRVTNDLIVATPKDIEGAITTDNVQDLNAIMKGLTANDISIEPPSEYKKRQEEEDERRSKKEAGAVGHAERGKIARAHVTNVNPLAMLNKTPLAPKNMDFNSWLSARLAGELERKDHGRLGMFIDYSKNAFTLEGNLGALASQYCAPLMPGLDDNEKLEELEAIEDGFGAGIRDQVGRTIDFVKARENTVVKYTISISALRGMAKVIDDARGTNIVGLLQDDKKLITLIGAVAQKILRRKVASWIFIDNDWENAVISDVQHGVKSFYLKHLGIDSSWTAATPFGGSEKDDLRLSRITTEKN